MAWAVSHTNGFELTVLCCSTDGYFFMVKRLTALFGKTGRLLLYRNHNQKCDANLITDASRLLSRPCRLFRQSSWIWKACFRRPCYRRRCLPRRFCRLQPAWSSQSAGRAWIWGLVCRPRLWQGTHCLRRCPAQRGTLWRQCYANPWWVSCVASSVRVIGSLRRSRPTIFARHFPFESAAAVRRTVLTIIIIRKPLEKSITIFRLNCV